jgi:hypothetical protein
MLQKATTVFTYRRHELLDIKSFLQKLNFASYLPLQSVNAHFISVSNVRDQRLW